MPPALRLLLVFRVRAGFRQLGRKLRSPRTALPVVLGALGLAFGFGLPWLPRLFAHLAVSQEQLQNARAMFSGVWFLMFLPQLLMRDEDRAIVFSPAEIALLFPAPLDRRQLLLYKIAGALGPLFLASLVLCGSLAVYAGNWPSAFTGSALSLLFLFLLGLTLNLVRELMAAHAYTTGRKLLLAGLLALFALALWQAGQNDQELELPARVRLMAESLPGRMLFAPIYCFTRVATAPAWSLEFAGWFSLSLMINLALMGLILRLDANYQEASVHRSQRAYDRWRRVQQSGTLSSGRQAVRPRWRLPAPPRWKGAGPILWRQLTAWMRKANVVVLALLILGTPVALSVLPFLKNDSPWTPVGVMLYLNLFFFSTQFAFDFRTDIEHMELLKSSPLHPLAVVLGELATPVLLATLVHGATVAVLVACYRWESAFLIALMFAPIVNLFLFAVENILNLLFPARPATGGTGQAQQLSRTMLFLIVKLVLFVLAGMAGALASALAFHAFDNSATAAAAAAWAVVAGLDALCVLLLVWAYLRFDPGLDTPA